MYKPRCEIETQIPKSKSESEASPFESTGFSHPTLTAKIVAVKWQRIASTSIGE